MRKSCGPCISLKAKCDQMRPCSRCISRRCEDLCSDVDRKARPRKEKNFITTLSEADLQSLHALAQMLKYHPINTLQNSVQQLQNPQHAQMLQSLQFLQNMQTTQNQQGPQNIQNPQNQQNPQSQQFLGLRPQGTPFPIPPTQNLHLSQNLPYESQRVQVTQILQYPRSPQNQQNSQNQQPRQGTQTNQISLHNPQYLQQFTIPQTSHSQQATQILPLAQNPHPQNPQNSHDTQQHTIPQFEVIQESEQNHAPPEPCNYLGALPTEFIQQEASARAPLDISAPHSSALAEQPQITTAIQENATNNVHDLCRTLVENLHNITHGDGNLVPQKLAQMRAMLDNFLRATEAPSRPREISVNLPTAIFNPTTTEFLDCNELFAKTLGQTPDNLLGRTVQAFIPSFALPLVASAMRLLSTCTDRISAHGERLASVRHSNGKYIHVRVYFQIMAGKNFVVVTLREFLDKIPPCLQYSYEYHLGLKSVNDPPGYCDNHTCVCKFRHLPYALNYRTENPSLKVQTK